MHPGRRLPDEYRPCDTTVSVTGKRVDSIAVRLVLGVVKPRAAGAARLTFAPDDAPTERYGRHVIRAGVRHNPSSSPAGGPFVRGPVWVILGLLACYPAWGGAALPLLARPHVRRKNLGGIAPGQRPTFQTKLELAVELVRRAATRLGFLGEPLWVVADGVHAKAPFLKPIKTFAPAGCRLIGPGTGR